MDDRQQAQSVKTPEKAQSSPSLDRETLKIAIIVIENYLQSMQIDLPPPDVAELVMRLHDWHRGGATGTGRSALTLSRGSAWIEGVLD